MTDLAEAIARCFFEAKKQAEFNRIYFSKTTLKPPAWKDCPAKERLEWMGAARRVLADKEILQALTNRAAAGL